MVDFLYIFWCFHTRITVCKIISTFCSPRHFPDCETRKFPLSGICNWESEHFSGLWNAKSDHFPGFWFSNFCEFLPQIFSQICPIFPFCVLQKTNHLSWSEKGFSSTVASISVFGILCYNVIICVHPYPLFCILCYHFIYSLYLFSPPSLFGKCTELLWNQAVFIKCVMSSTVAY